MGLTLLILATTFVILLFKIISSRYSREWQLVYKIPGPPTLPLVGNLFQMMHTQEKFFKEDRKRALTYYPIYKLSIMHIKAVNLVNPEDIELLLTNMKHITKGMAYDFLHGWLGTGLLTSTNEKWQARRKLLTPAFHFNILQEFLNIFNDETKKLNQRLREDSSNKIDVLPAITYFALYSITETAMGLKLDEQADKETYKSSIYKVGELLMQRVTRPWIHNDFIYSLTKDGKEFNKILKSLHEFTKSVINERKKTFNSSYSTSKRLAMLDLLLKYQSEGAKIDDDGILEEVDTFMFEGHDTTSMAISFALLLIANHKKVQEDLYDEIVAVIDDSKPPTYAELQELSYMERVIKEVLRLYPSVPFIQRVAGEDMKTATGYLIPKGCQVSAEIYDLHHNPNVFPDPERFDPDRFLPENTQGRHPFAYIPFSAGPRNCIGQKFAMVEIKAVLSGILREFILEPVTKPEDVVFIADLVLRPKNSIYVKFVPRDQELHKI